MKSFLLNYQLDPLITMLSFCRLKLSKYILWTWTSIKVANHAFCFPDRIFEDLRNTKKTFVSACLRKWKDTIAKFRKYQFTAVHITAMERWAFWETGT